MTAAPSVTEDWDQRRADNRQALPDALADTADLPSVLLPYQARLLQTTAQHQLVVVEKSRRIGMTWGVGADAVLSAGSAKDAGGMDVLYIGYNLDMAREFDYRVGTFHHGVEAYKIADELAENGVCGALWADWWGFKMEAYDGIQENIALVDRPQNGCAIVHSDSSEGIQRLNQEAAKAMIRGQRAGLDIPPERAIRWITQNPARSLGIEDRTGTLAEGKMADVVLWSGDPFSVYTKADQVYIDGALAYDRANPALQPVSDFELGQLQEAK